MCYAHRCFEAEPGRVSVDGLFAAYVLRLNVLGFVSAKDPMHRGLAKARRGAMAKAAVFLSGCVVLLLAQPTLRAQTVGDEADKPHGCTTGPVKTLARQFAKSQTCLFPEALTEIEPQGGLTLSSGANAFASPQTRDALYKAAKSATFHVNSAFRTMLEQYFLSTARDPACGSVAPVGTSNHESGSAVDVQQWDTAKKALLGAGCVWPNIPNDPWHFDCPPFNAKKLTVLAFQKLWNLNNPQDPISEDGSFGPQTESRLRMTPMTGFAYDGCGPNCSSGTGDDPACAEQLLESQPLAYAPPTTTDVDGDGSDDLCARGVVGLKCWPSSAAGWQMQGWEAIAWSDENGWAQPARYASLRMGDVNGDGLADACARSAKGLECATSRGDGFAESAVWQAEMTDEAGWSEPSLYTTLRLADVNGDGMDDLCARASAGFGCWLSDGEAFSQYLEGPAWSDDAGFSDPAYYGTLRMGDLNADGRADVCIRGPEGISCATAGETGFTAEVAGPAWSDDAGYRGRERWSTLRMADVSGDGLADLCVRTPEDYHCRFSIGNGFDEPVVVAKLDDASGWDDPTNYETIRVGDINGDGANDICARADSEVRCWHWTGESFAQVAGPAWTDDGGWKDASYYQTLRLGDFDGDGLSDICARAAEGWRCHRSTASAFEEPLAFTELEDSTGWARREYWSTILFGGVRAGGDNVGPKGDPLPPRLISTCRATRGGKPLPMVIVVMIVVLGLHMRRRTV